MRITFSSGPLQLEGVLSTTAASARGAVICHPHPQYGGDMNNPVVLAAATALHDAGHTTLRFNFRGVGASSGSYGGGIAEVDDVRAAVDELLSRCGAQRITLAGYSFGAMVALQAGPDLAAVDRLIAIAPPVSFFSLEGIAACTKEKLFIVGDRDQYCSLDQLTQQLATVAEPKAQRILRGADHFFAGQEHAVADSVRSFV